MLKTALYLQLFLASAPFLAYAQPSSPPPAPLPFNARSFPYVDVHIHPSVKPFNSRYIRPYTMWEIIDHDCDGKMSNLFINGSKDVPKTTQCNLERLAKGNVKFGYLSLIPLEKESLEAAFFNEKKKGVATMSCVAGVDLSKLPKRKEGMDYYKDLADNILYVKEGQSKPHYIDGQAHTYQIIQTAEQLEKVTQTPNTIGLVLNIEGGHAIGHSIVREDISKSISYEKYCLANVDRLKGSKPLEDGKKDLLEFPILSLGLTHFFWNGLCGHARNFMGAQKIVFGQQKGLNEGITPLGEKVIKRLLDKSHGRRIFLDIKHMSVASRKWYYQHLESLRQKGDTVPVFSSHSAMTGWSFEDKEFQRPDNNGKLKDAYLFNWTIGLSSEDIREAHLTKGLLGLIFDKNRLMGGKAEKLVEETVVGSNQRRRIYQQVIWANFFTAVKTINDKSGWDILAVGSDYDGMITPFEFYPTSKEMPYLVKDMHDFLSAPTDIFTLFSKEEVERLMFGYTPEQILEKIFYSNAYEFTRRALKNVQPAPPSN